MQLSLSQYTAIPLHTEQSKSGSIGNSVQVCASFTENPTKSTLILRPWHRQSDQMHSKHFKLQNGLNYLLTLFGT